MDTNTSTELADWQKKSPLWTRETDSEQETLALARTLGAHLRGGDWVCLIGELGTGKTLFVQGVGESLKCEGPVRSPTFVMVQTHKAGGRGLELHHVDLYRLSQPEVAALDWQELLTGPAVTVVEWAEKAVAYWPPNCLIVQLFHLEPGRRKLEFRGQGERPAELVQFLKKSVR